MTSFGSNSFSREPSYAFQKKLEEIYDFLKTHDFEGATEAQVDKVVQGIANQLIRDVAVLQGRKISPKREREIFSRIHNLDDIAQTLKGEGKEALEDLVYLSSIYLGVQLSDEEGNRQKIELARFPSKQELIREARQGDPEARRLFTTLFRKGFFWAVEQFVELVGRKDTWIAPYLAEDLQPKDLENRMVLEVLIMAADKRPLFYSHVLGKGMFFHIPDINKIFGEDIVTLLLEKTWNGSKTAKNLLLAIISVDTEAYGFVQDQYIASTHEKRHFFAELSEKRSALTEWVKGTPVWKEKEELTVLEYQEPLFLKHLLFMQLTRENILVETLMGKAPTPLPHPPVSGDFPLTEAWIFGVEDYPSEGGEHSIYREEAVRKNYQYRAAQFMTEVGLKNGIETVISGNFPEVLGAKTVKTSAATTWVQDNMSFSIVEGKVGSSIRVPAIVPVFELDLLDPALKKTGQEGRRDRPFTCLGQTARQGENLKAAKFAHRTHSPFFLNPCFDEGGNTLVGVDKGGETYAIIGIDTIWWNQKTLAFEMARLGYVKEGGSWQKKEGKINLAEIEDLSSEEVVKLLAIGLAIAPKRIHICSQIDYHLDMDIKIIGPKTLLVNNRDAAAHSMVQAIKSREKDNAEKLIEIDQLVQSRQFFERARKRKKIEDRVAAQLKQQGFKVFRFGGHIYHPVPELVFMQRPEQAPTESGEGSSSRQEASITLPPQMQRQPNIIEGGRVNFLNCVSAETPGPDSKKILLAFSAFYQELNEQFLAFITSLVPDLSTENVYFFEHYGSERFLFKDGGLACMTKVCHKEI